MILNFDTYIYIEKSKKKIQKRHTYKHLDNHSQSKDYNP